MPRRLALLIGNTHFEDSKNFNHLHAPANDVYNFADVLEKYGYFQIVNILLDKNVDEIKQSIEAFYDSAQQGDLTLLYYSGHGYKHINGKLYLVTQNTQTTRILSTGIQESFIRDAMSYSKSRHHLVVLDCCFSGSFIKGQKSGREPLLLETLKGEASAILTSSSSIQYSFESKGNGQNSLFTYYLIQGMKNGQADENKDGLITAEELFYYAERLVREQRPEQTPMLSVSSRKSCIVFCMSNLTQEGGASKAPVDKQEKEYPNFYSSSIIIIKKNTAAIIAIILLVLTSSIVINSILNKINNEDIIPSATASQNISITNTKTPSLTVTSQSLITLSPTRNEPIATSTLEGSPAPTLTPSPITPSKTIETVEIAETVEIVKTAETAKPTPLDHSDTSDGWGWVEFTPLKYCTDASDENTCRDLNSGDTISKSSGYIRWNILVNPSPSERVYSNEYSEVCRMANEGLRIQSGGQTTYLQAELVRQGYFDNIHCCSSDNESFVFLDTKKLPDWAIENTQITVALKVWREKTWKGQASGETYDEHWEQGNSLFINIDP